MSACSALSASRKVLAMDVPNDRGHLPENKRSGRQLVLVMSGEALSLIPSAALVDYQADWYSMWVRDDVVGSYLCQPDLIWTRPLAGISQRKLSQARVLTSNLGSASDHVAIAG